jgi:hypothetical protein
MFGIKISSYLCSQNIHGVENAVLLHVDIPRTGGRGIDLPSEDALQEYLQFPCQYFRLVLPFGSYSSKFCPSNNKKETLLVLGSGERAGKMLLLIILFQRH